MRPIREVHNSGFNDKELRRIRRIIMNEADIIENKWNAFFEHS